MGTEWISDEDLDQLVTQRARQVLSSEREFQNNTKETQPISMIEGAGASEQDRTETELASEKKRTNPRAKYPWDVWFDGKLHVLTRGVDFDKSAHNFQITALNTARRKDVFLRSSVQRDRVRIIIQAFKSQEDANEAWADSHDTA
jgi:hypothetical protein